MNNFRDAVDFTLSWEGEGGVAQAGDPGGLTKWGISQRAHPEVDVANLTKEGAEQIYEQDYWNAIDATNLPQPFDVAAFDTAVNCGVGRALGWLQESKTWQDFLLKRVKHYVELARKQVYFRGILFGLMRRVVTLADLCRSLDN